MFTSCGKVVCPHSGTASYPSTSFNIGFLWNITSRFSVVPLQVPPVNQEAVKNGEVLRVSNRTCESVTLVGNTLECTVPMELQTATKELEVEVRSLYVPL